MDSLTPLSEITQVENAYESIASRRTHLRGAEQFATPSTEQSCVLESAASAQLELEFFTRSPILAAKKSRLPPPAHCLQRVLFPSAEESDEFLTPQRKLLKSIEQVEKVVMEELMRLSRTPSAKKTERAKKVRILMDMR